MEADFQVCRNCKRNVPSLHFTLHEAHCLHFLALCPECEEPILQSKMKEHVEAVHQQNMQKQSLIYLRNGKPIILPSSLAIMETEKQTSTLRKDVRPKTKIRSSSRKQKTKDQSDTADLPLMSVLQQGAALPARDEDAYDILRRRSA
ncbi:XIAP-associated factor 1 isoform X2 [Psammomys obesus]|uniref:XIAP-associated factor 1 isoform X2 n=1 Tax=Psammomys obesus TaxID=48139 RepID=UPI002452E1F2|nr:XIAP-associated factor 1 isoform X2 [Psammomys obesus]